MWFIVIAIFVAAFGLMEGWFFRFQFPLPALSNILLIALINLNVVLLLVLVYLVLRRIVKLVFERKRNILGHHLRTRLVIAFVGLTVIPTLPLFGMATKFISHSIDYWFSRKMEQSLFQAVDFGRDYMKEVRDDLTIDCDMIKSDLIDMFGADGLPNIRSEQVTATLMRRYHLNALYFLDPSGKLVWSCAHPPHLQALQAGEMQDLLRNELESAAEVHVLSLDPQDALITSCPITESNSPSGAETGTLVALRLLPQRLTEKIASFTNGYEDFLQIKLLHKPVRTSHVITFSIVTLLVIFAAIWFGFSLAKNITIPIQHLVEATQTIAEGNLDVQLVWEHKDEIGMLVSSFNKMVRDLSESREQLAGAYTALQNSHLELEARRRYMEIVLRNIAAGVVSADAEGNITTMNKSAETMLGFKAEDVIGRHYARGLTPAHMDIVQSFLDMYHASGNSYLEQQVHVIFNDRPVVLLIKVTVFRDEQDKCLGTVVVFDDLTDLVKIQRMAAWRDVARRIAHEIKNPLTPIQLSAQRLRRKYADLLDTPDGALLEECTRTITQQVDIMKHLVNEFSNFARLPRANPVPSDLGAIVEECIALFRHTYPDVSFKTEKDPSFPILKLDQVQFKQVLTNLLENAVQALNGEEKDIRVSLGYDPVLRIAKMECADTGHGLPAEDKLRIFEPYYSTKEKGMGLGLAIVAGIIADHNGFIRVHDNNPQGTVIVIELPA